MATLYTPEPKTSGLDWLAGMTQNAQQLWQQQQQIQQAQEKISLARKQTEIQSQQFWAEQARLKDQQGFQNQKFLYEMGKDQRDFTRQSTMDDRNWTKYQRDFTRQSTMDDRNWTNAQEDNALARTTEARMGRTSNWTMDPRNPDNRWRESQANKSEAETNDLYGPGQGTQTSIWQVPSDVTDTSLAERLPEPMKSLAPEFVAAGKKYGVNPNFLASISMFETGRGTSSAFTQKGNAMGVSNSQGPLDFGDSGAPDSIDYMARRLADPKGPYAKAKTIGEIGNIYAPPRAENDPNGTNNQWSGSVSKMYDTLRGGEGRSTNSYSTRAPERVDVGGIPMVKFPRAASQGGDYYTFAPTQKKPADEVAALSKELNVLSDNYAGLSKGIKPQMSRPKGEHGKALANDDPAIEQWNKQNAAIEDVNTILRERMAAIKPMINRYEGAIKIKTNVFKLTNISPDMSQMIPTLDKAIKDLNPGMIRLLRPQIEKLAQSGDKSAEEALAWVDDIVGVDAGPKKKIEAAPIDLFKPR